MYKITLLDGTRCLCLGVLWLGIRLSEVGLMLKAGTRRHWLEVHVNRKSETVSRAFVVRWETHRKGIPIFYVVFPVHGPSIICKAMGHVVFRWKGDRRLQYWGRGVGADPINRYPFRGE